MGGRRAAVVAGVGLVALATLGVVLLGDAEEPPDRPAPDEVGLDSDLVVVELPGRPAAVASGPAGLWLVEDGTGTLVQLDPEDGSPVGEAVAVGPSPRAVAVGDDVVWVAGADGTVLRVVPGGPTRPERFEVGGALVDVVIEGDGAMVGDIEAGTVRRIDADGAVGPAIVVPEGVVRLAVGPRTLWVTGLEGAVTPVDLQTGSVGAPVGVGAGPIGMAVADDVLWVANSDDRTVSRLDARTGRALGRPLPVGPAPISVVVHDGQVWVLDQDGPTVTRLRGADGGPAGGPIDLPMRPRGMAWTSAGLWVVGVDPASGALVRPEA